MEQFDDYSAMLESMLGTVESLNQLRNQAYRHYSSLISLILRNEISSEHQLVRDHVALYRALFEPAEEDNEE